MRKSFSLKRTLASVLLTALALVTVTACGGTTDSSGTGDSSADKIVIGALAPLTGGVSVYGIAASNGVKLAVKEINANGGIDGKLIDLQLLDEKGDEQEAITAFNRLVEENKIVALLGDVTSKPTIAVAQRAALINMPMLTATATAADVTKQGDNVFRVCFIDPDQGVLMAEFASDTLDAKTAAIIYNAADDYSVGLAEAFEDKANELGLEITASESYPADTTNFSTQLTRIAQDNPDVLFVPDYYGTNILILQQARAAGITGAVLGGDGWDGILTQVEESNPEEADGVYFTNHFFAEDQGKNVADFVAAYEAEYGEKPISFAALGYDSAYMMAEAIDAAGSTDSQAIIDALSAIEYAGVTGNLTFGDSGDPNKEVSVIRIDGGEYQLEKKMEIVR